MDEDGVCTSAYSMCPPFCGNTLVALDILVHETKQNKQKKDQDIKIKNKMTNKKKSNKILN